MITEQIVKSKNLNMGTVLENYTATVAGLTTGIITTTTDIAVVICANAAYFVTLPSAGSYGVGRILRIVSARNANLGFLILGNASTDTLTGLAGNMQIGAGGYRCGVNQTCYLRAVTSTGWEVWVDDMRLPHATVACTATVAGATTGIVPTTAKYVDATSPNDAYIITLPDPLTFGVGLELVIALSGAGSDCVYTPGGTATINHAATLTVGQGNVTTFLCTSTTTWQARTQVGLIA